jgi:23S rRNA (uracil1939-C5)-methyltransferase
VTPVTDVATLVAVRPVFGGACIATPEGGGAFVLVTGAIPGERVRARLTTRKGVSFGVVTDVLDASPDRVPTPRHPGLDYGHVAPARQLALLADVLDDAMRRAMLGTDVAPVVAPVVAAPHDWGYRQAIQPAVAGRAGAGTALGYRRPGGHEIVTLDVDPTAHPAAAAAYAAVQGVALPNGVREVAIRGGADGAALIALIATTAPRDLLDVAHALVQGGVTGVAAAPFDPRGRFRGGATRLAGARTIRDRFGDVTSTLTATGFAQPNPAAAGNLFRELAAWAPPARHALDLYGGSGVIGMHLAATSERVTVIDIDRGSIERGRADAAAAGLRHVEHLRHDARDVRIPDDVDLISVDPPRAGLSAATRAAIASCGAATLLYVSCDVATWARDVADLTRRGFTLQRVTPYQFLPGTHHLEILSLLTRAEGW